MENHKMFSALEQIPFFHTKLTKLRQTRPLGIEIRGNIQM